MPCVVADTSPLFYLATISDELQSRAKAAPLGLTITGMVGVLIEAELRGLIPAIGPRITRLLEETTFWLGRQMEQAALRMVGELPPPSPS